MTAGNPTIENVAIRPRFLDDGGRVFFSTAESLVPQDRNGVADTYEYDGATGELSLLSTGKGRDPVMFADASKSGDDVFVLGRQRLLSSDRDDLVDLYDVRVGPAPPGQQIQETPPCDGEGCQPPPSTAPAEDTPGSLLFEDNVLGPFAPKALVVRRRATFHGASGSLRVRLLVPGTLKWSGRGLRSGACKARQSWAGSAVCPSHETCPRAAPDEGQLQDDASSARLVQADGAGVTGATRVTFRVTAKKGR